MTIWTYLVESIELTEDAETAQKVFAARWFNEFGSGGWELVSITPIILPGGMISQKAHVVFKRPVGP